MTTRRTYVGYVERTIKPALGRIGIDKLGARELETFYAQLRRCRARCDGRPFIERHRAKGEHECGDGGCVAHTCPANGCPDRPSDPLHHQHACFCRPLDWIGSNPARVALRPRAKAPEPLPPSPADAAWLLDTAFEMDADWATLVWLVMTTGIRRGEVYALRWRDVDLDSETIEIAVAEYIDWYSHRRLHGELGLVPPVEYEARHHAHQAARRPAGG